MEKTIPPVITIDGPSGVGKGTLSQMLAQKLGWHFLDSGAIYRVLAFAAMQQQVDLQDEVKLEELALHLPVSFIDGKVLLNQLDISAEIRSEACGNAASVIGALPRIRTALLQRQRAFRQWPGLVTDGRDMGTVIFPDAIVKFFFTASREERAKRRYNQLKAKGIHASLEQILQDLEQRDLRDRERSVAPLKPAEDAELIDTTTLTINEVFTKLIARVGRLIKL